MTKQKLPWSTFEALVFAMDEVNESATNEAGNAAAAGNASKVVTAAQLKKMNNWRQALVDDADELVPFEEYDAESKQKHNEGRLLFCLACSRVQGEKGLHPINSKYPFGLYRWNAHKETQQHKSNVLFLKKPGKKKETMITAFFGPRAKRSADSAGLPAPSNRPPPGGRRSLPAASMFCGGILAPGKDAKDRDERQERLQCFLKYGKFTKDTYVIRESNGRLSLHTHNCGSDTMMHMNEIRRCKACLLVRSATQLAYKGVCRQLKNNHQKIKQIEDILGRKYISEVEVEVIKNFRHVAIKNLSLEGQKLRELCILQCKYYVRAQTLAKVDALRELRESDSNRRIVAGADTFLQNFMRFYNGAADSFKDSLLCGLIEIAMVSSLFPQCCAHIATIANTNISFLPFHIRLNQRDIKNPVAQKK